MDNKPPLGNNIPTTYDSETFLVCIYVTFKKVTFACE